MKTRVVLILLGLLLLWPVSVRAQALIIDFNSALFRWDFVDDPLFPVETFDIYCGRSSGNYSKTTVVSDPTARSFSVKSAITGSGVWYCVMDAANRYGQSAPTAEIFFDAGAAPSSPTNFRVSVP